MIQVAAVTVLALLGGVACGGQTLSNGIVLPDDWPPEIRHFSREPMPVPYLENPPPVVPIDLGRQLFVDDFLIESTTLNRRYHHPVPSEASPVLQPETELEMNHGHCPMAAPFNDGLWYDPEDTLKTAGAR